MRRLLIVTAILIALVVSVGHGSEVQLTVTTAPGDCHSPEWCSSLGRISFSANRNGLADIWVMDEAGEAVNTWRATQVPVYTDTDPSWNAGCSHVYFSGSQGGDYRIYYIKVVTPNSPIPVSLEAGNDRAPHASDGGVVFYSDRAGNDDIMWMDLGGEGSSTYLTTNGADDRYPNWAPSDTLVAFASDRGGNWDIWLMNAAGESRGVWALTSNAADETHPAFSPGGDLVAFHRDGVGIMVIDVVTRLEYQITSNPTDTEPCWSPTGMEIAFAREVAGEYHIWVTNNVPDTTVKEVTWGRVKALYR